MAFNISGVGAILMGWIFSPILWLLIILGILAIAWTGLVIRRKRLLRYETVEIVDLGKGKTSLNFIKSGWFGINSYFKGLWWNGREVMKTEDGEIIEDFSETDFQEVNGERGIIVYRDPINRLLVPISHLEMKNKHLVAEIANASFRDVAVDIVKDAEHETTDWTEKVIMWAVMGGLIVFALVSIIIIIQFIKGSEEKASNLILEAGKTCLENAKQVCNTIVTARSNAP